MVVHTLVRSAGLISFVAVRHDQEIVNGPGLRHREWSRLWHREWSRFAAGTNENKHTVISAEEWAIGWSWSWTRHSSECENSLRGITIP